MFQTLCELIPHDADYPPRVRRLDILRRVLEGSLYDVLPYAFHDERDGAGDYIPLRRRRPNVRYALPRIVVEDSVALLFSEGHFPTVDSPVLGVREALADVVKECRLNEVMVHAAIRGSVGSVAILLRVLKGRLYFDVLDSLYLTPVWRADAPDELERVVERYKVSGAALAAEGYALPDPAAEYWFMRAWDATDESWFLPTQVGSRAAPMLDENRSVRHGLGFVPMVWVRNLPGGDRVDGGCTFRAAIETSIEIDYQLSQAGRGLKYSADPTLLIKEPAGLDAEMVRGAGNAVVVSEKGDAKLLEIGGTASQAVVEYVRTLRELGLESVHGNRADASRLSAATSGRALELMNQGLVWLADNLRVSYGEGALLGLMRMVLRARRRYPLRVMNAVMPEIDANAPLTLKWPRWYPPTAEDRQRDAQTLSTLLAARIISQPSAVAAIADNYDIENVPAELERIESQKPSPPPGAERGG